MGNINLQFAKAVEYLVRNKIANSKGDVASKLNLKQNALSEILSGRNKLNIDAARDFCKTYQISLDWLFYDEGDMFASKKEEEPDEKVTISKVELQALIRQEIQEALKLQSV